MNKQISLIIIICLTAFGSTRSYCSAGQTLVEATNNYIKRPQLGTTWSVNPAGFFAVDLVTKDSPAELAGIKPNDLILEVDGLKFHNRVEWNHLVSKYVNNNRLITLTIKRSGQTKKVQVRPKIVESRPTILKLLELVDTQKVALAVFVNHVRINYQQPANFVLDVWKESIYKSLLGAFESSVLSGLGNNENFSMIDRNTGIKIKEEFEFGQSELLTEEMRKVIGNMKGATHLGMIEYSRSSAGKGYYSDEITTRLIDIETGRILAVDNQKNKYKNN